VNGNSSSHFIGPLGCWLRVSGSDAGGFLQGQFTNDLRGLGPDGAVYGLWLNQKGKVVADGFILAAADGTFRIGSYFSPAAAICRRLEDYIVADDVVVEDETQGWSCASIIGEGAGAWLRGLSPREGWIFPGRRTAGENWEWVYPASSSDSVRERLASSAALDAAGLERLRIESGIPAIPADAGPGDLPEEAGLHNAAISTTKGCYLGQEITARLRSKGTVRRRLLRVRGSGPVPAVPAALLHDGRRVGELRSAAADRPGTGFIGLAMVASPVRPEAGACRVEGRPDDAVFIEIV
jgi:folate-binding protein YgfZ